MNNVTKITEYDYDMLRYLKHRYEDMIFYHVCDDVDIQSELNEIIEEIAYRKDMLKLINNGGSFMILEQTVNGYNAYHFTILDCWEHHFTKEHCYKCRKEYCYRDLQNNLISGIEDKYFTARELMDKHLYR